MNHSPHPKDDPRGLIAESYRIKDITAPECRSIFLDWALEPRSAQELQQAAQNLAQHYASQQNHPMTALLQQAATTPPAVPRKRRRRKPG